MEKKGYPLTFGRDKMEEKHPDIPQQVNCTLTIHLQSICYKGSSGKQLCSVPAQLMWLRHIPSALRRTCLQGKPKICIHTSFF